MKGPRPVWTSATKKLSHCSERRVWRGGWGAFEAAGEGLETVGWLARK